MTSATTSLPTPLSPVMSTRVSDGAISEASRNTACMSGLRAITDSGNVVFRVVLQRSGFRNADGLPHGIEQFIEVNRLGQIIDRAVAHRGHGIADVGEGGDEQDGQGGVFLARAPQRFQAGQPRHPHVGNHHGEFPGAAAFPGRVRRNPPAPFQNPGCGETNSAGCAGRDRRPQSGCAVFRRNGCGFRPRLKAIPFRRCVSSGGYRDVAVNRKRILSREGMVRGARERRERFWEARRTGIFENRNHNNPKLRQERNMPPRRS